MPQTIRFGPAGNSESFYAQGHKLTNEAPAWLHAMGLGAFEYSFGRGVRITPESAALIREQALAYNIALSIHMPYYINLATETPEKQANNFRYFQESLIAARHLGARRAVFHPGSAAGGREDALQRAMALFSRIYATILEEGYGDITLCPETMGKINQLGDLREVLILCTLNEQLLPCIDFGHLHCRGLGTIQTKSDYAAILDTIENTIGLERARKMHVHFSRMEYTAQGERRHHTFADTQYGPDFPPLAALFAERQYTPVIICESNGTMAEDAAAMQQMYMQCLEFIEKPC